VAQPPSLPPPLPPPNKWNGPAGYRELSGGKWWRYTLFLVGFPVELSESQTHRKPIVTVGLALLIALCSVLFWQNPDPWAPLVFDPQATGLSWWTGTIGYLFLHADILHLAGNLYFLLIFGNNIECQFGRRRMLGMFLIASMAGAILHGLLSPHALVGASGGVFGLVIFYALQFPHARILWLPFGWLVNAGMLIFGRKILHFGLPVRLYVAGYLIIQLILLREQLFYGGVVSALAHLGGGLAGGLIWRAWKKGWLP
jgi:membrane associated rhomboid family serine protease